MSAPPPDVPPPGRSAEVQIASRMRFEDAAKFVEFYEKQLGRHVVGLRHPEPVAVGTEMLVIISPPGAPDQLRMMGRVAQVTPRRDGSVRLRVEVQPRDADAGWLGAYLVGLRAGLDRASAAPEGAPDDTAPLPRIQSTPAPTEDLPDQIRALYERLDTLTYYDLLQVPRDVDAETLQITFHALTRRHHPDLYHGHADAGLLQAINAVYRRMNEAYSTLKSPRRRRAYDEGLVGAPHTWRLRLSEEDHDAARRHERVRRGSTRVGDYYWRRAREVLETARESEVSIRPALRESARLLRVAMAFEPDNEHFRHALEQVCDRLASPVV
ncbi:MAG: DnaJ domain-containing protein [Myxococcales bacterium]|nr:DnaJ domain-containing protein [Myxococcales bacterium]